MPLTVLAQIKAAPGKAELVRVELEKLVPITRGEAGCLQYDLHVDNADAELFVMFETWENSATLEAHSKAPHLAGFRAATKGAIAEFSVNRMTKLA